MNSSATLTGCDDTIKRLREAIAARPTPGPWTVMPANAGEHCVARINAWEAVPPSSCELSSDTVDAAYIAAASPDNIAALLDRLDKAERECERLRSAINWACGYDEGEPHFGEQPEQDAPYAWRHELRRRAGMPWKVERREK